MKAQEIQLRSVQAKEWGQMEFTISWFSASIASRIFLNQKWRYWIQVSSHREGWYNLQPLHSTLAFSRLTCIQGYLLFLAEPWTGVRIAYFSIPAAADFRNLSFWAMDHKWREGLRCPRSYRLLLWFKMQQICRIHVDVTSHRHSTSGDCDQLAWVLNVPSLNRALRAEWNWFQGIVGA